VGLSWFFCVYLGLICLKHENLQISQLFPSFSLQTSLMLAASHGEEEQLGAPWCFLGILGTHLCKAVSSEAPLVSLRLMGSSCLAEKLCFSAKSLK